MCAPTGRGAGRVGGQRAGADPAIHQAGDRTERASLSADHHRLISRARRGKVAAALSHTSQFSFLPAFLLAIM